MKKNLRINLFRLFTLLVTIAGAIGSLSYMFHAGRNNKSIVLIILFTGWVFSPFFALLVSNLISRSWTTLTQNAVYILSLVLSILSLVIYSGKLSPPGTKTAFVFLVVPLVSWLLLVIIILVSASLSKRRAGKEDIP